MLFSLFRKLRMNVKLRFERFDEGRLASASRYLLSDDIITEAHANQIKLIIKVIIIL